MIVPRPAINLLSLVTAVLYCALMFASCKKGDVGGTVTPINTDTKPLGVIKLTGVVSGSNKKLTLSIVNLGSVTVNKDCTLSTMVAGLDMDASGILPASMIGPSGFVFTGDSIIYNGITLTNKAGVVTHGDMLNATKLYGNLAYATMTFGDGSATQITTKRIPFFLYYKAVDATGATVAAHGADFFGVGPGVSSGNKLISSPLSYLPVSGNLMSGFKLSMATFNAGVQQAACLLTIGLTPTDLEASSGFNLHPLAALPNNAGYASYIQGTVVYNSTSLAGQIAFNTAYTSTAILQDSKYTGTTYSALPPGATVHIVTNNGFNYLYTVSATANLTGIENPTSSGETRNIFGIDFFMQNELLIDYTDHQLGVKNVVR